MTPWTLHSPVDEHSGPTYTRPLSLNETGYYWDCCFHGTTDLVWHYIVHSNSKLFTEANVHRAWKLLKHRYPLLGSQVCTKGGDSPVFLFEVAAKRLNEPLPGEVICKTVASADEALTIIEEIIHGPQRTFSLLPARLFVLQRIDDKTTHHVLINTAHFIADGFSHIMLCRSFFNILSVPSPETALDLAERLAMVVECEEMNPARSLSISRQRWRRAIGAVIFYLRRRHLRGGHTLPAVIGSQTYRTPVMKKDLRYSLSAETTSAILAACRERSITLTMALPVVAQLATARILHKQYCDGKMTDVEWEHRKQEPMHFFLPISLRPYLNQEWLAKGGLAEVFLSVNLFYCTLPFMPTTPKSGSSDATNNKLLLSDGRFLLRCNLVKKQMESYMRHPLFLEIVEASLQQSVAKRRLIASQECGQTFASAGEDGMLSSVFGGDTTYTVGVSSAGNYDLLQPSAYPLPLNSGETIGHSVEGSGLGVPLLRIASWETHLHVRPAYFYLGALTTQGCISFLLSWDGNVYDPELVHDWFREVEDILLWYLARK